MQGGARAPLTMEGIELPAALALLLAPDLIGARQRERKRRLDVRMAFDLAADVTDPAKPCAQDAQFATVAVELLGMGHSAPPSSLRACTHRVLTTDTGRYAYQRRMRTTTV